MADRMLTIAEARRRGLSADPFEFTDVTAHVPQLAEADPDLDVRFFESRWFFVARHEVLDADDHPLTWLSMRRNDRRPLHDFRHLQRIKNELCGPEREGLQVYPAESRLMDESNQTHLWVYPEGDMIPVGYLDRSVLTKRENHLVNQIASNTVGRRLVSVQRAFSDDIEAQSRSLDELDLSPMRDTLHRPQNPRRKP